MAKVKPTRVTQTFDLTTDPDKIARVTARQASWIDLEEHRGLLGAFEQTRRERGGGTEVVFHFTPNEYQQISVELYLGLASVVGIEDEQGSEVFKSSANPRTGGMQIKNAMSLEEFKIALGMLDQEMVEEMHKCVLAVNPQWDPSAQKK
jgi:hypothetical protein